MLYVTTRVKQDTFTASHTLCTGRGPEGGFFVPKTLPVYPLLEIKALGSRSFSQNVADVINRLFGTSMDGWTVEFAIGRYPVKLANVGSRTLVAETWHNPAWRFDRLARGVEKAIRQSDQVRQEPSDWLVIASRIAVLFGIFGELIKVGAVSADMPMDVVVPTGDFSAPMACWYARKMGLPIANILACCNENGGAWNLIHKGEIRTDSAVVKTDTPLCDHAVPEGLERLIFSALGLGKTVEFTECCRKNSNFYLEPHELQSLRNGLYAAVVSKRQMEAAVASLYGSSGYLADPYSALCVAGIGLYRSKSGESRPALVLSEESPRFHLGTLARCLGTTAAQLKSVFD